MSTPKNGDVLIREDAATRTGAFVLLDAVTLKRLRGPYGTLAAAASAARDLAGTHGAVWRENVDNRGRSLGAPIRLSAERP
jgi:hypothetical protein